jgi:hypothetical protein
VKEALLSIFGQAAVQLQGSLPVVCLASRCAPQCPGQEALEARYHRASLGRPAQGLRPPREGALSLPRRGRHAPGQWVVVASRRSAAPGSQELSAAMEVSAGPACAASSARMATKSPCLAKPERLPIQNAGSSRSGEAAASPSVMPNPSIERTSQGLRPCAASHVKR